MTPIKPSDSTTSRLEQSNIDEAEENDLKNNFRRMFEALKKEMKTALEQREEKTNKKLEDINKFLKENQKKQSNV